MTRGPRPTSVKKTVSDTWGQFTWGQLARCETSIECKLTIKAREEGFPCGIAIGSGWPPAFSASFSPLRSGRPPSLPRAHRSRAVRLYQNRQYGDAARVLLEEIGGKAEADCGPQFLLLGECYYLTGEYGLARPYFLKAGRFLPDGPQRISAERRLATVCFRLGDLDEALQRITLFQQRHPDDPQLGKLLAYRMLILGRRGKEAQGDLETAHQQIQDKLQQYGYATGMEADRILCDFYRQTGQPEMARDLYARLVHNFQRVISERKESGQSLPAEYELAHDNAALQLGAMYVEQGQADEAIKWLENVRYDLPLKQQARLLLAKLAFEKRDFSRVIHFLTENGYIQTVPAGPVKSDMYLLLGLAERYRPDGNPGRVEEYLRNVGADSKGFAAAQSTLGDIYRERRLPDQAIEAYKHAAVSPEHGAHAIYWLGAIYTDQGAQAAEPARPSRSFARRRSMFEQLLVRHPLAPQVKQAREKLAILEARGIDVSFSRNEQNKLKSWEETARGQPGSVQAAEALLGLIRAHAKAVVEPGSGRVLQPQDYPACAAACDRLLDAAVYTGGGMPAEAWRGMQAEALYRRGQCEIGSLAPGGPAEPDAVSPKLLPQASASRGVEFFTRAQQLVDPKQLDMVRNIELGLLEALLKSDRDEHRQQAEEKFAELEADYGTDERFQRLALDLAGWYEKQQRWAEAAGQYAGVAHRGQTLDEETRLKLHYTSGLLYSRAAHEAQQSRDPDAYAVYIYPQEVVELGDDLLKTYAPLQKTVNLEWPGGGRDILAGEALAALSRRIEVPFVWSPEGGRDTVADYLSQKRLQLTSGPHREADVLARILDLEHHRLAFDIGLTGGEPTIALTAPENDDPEADRARTGIEIYDVRQADRRFAPLTRPYGSFDQAHGRSGRSTLLYGVLQRLEELSGTRIVWADGIDTAEKQAAEYREFPGISTGADATCARVLAGALQPLELRYKIIRRPVALDLYESAKEQFNKIRQISPKSKYGERSLFALAINFYNLSEYDKMKLVLREYLKLFDTPSHEHYREACFWVGWAFERERRFRDACEYYARAAEERLAVYLLKPDEKPASREQLAATLSYDLQFALAERLSGELLDKNAADIADFLHLNTLVNFRIDASAQADSARASLPKFQDVPAWELLCTALEQLGASFWVENADPAVAEKAYYRMASAYAKDNLMPQALENCEVLLSRFPQTSRRAEAYRLMLDIYRGLKDYGQVVKTLERLREEAGSDLEKYQYDFELGRIYFDMADYGRAADEFQAALAAASLSGERLAIRDAYAKALFRSGRHAEALAQFSTLAKEERDPLRVLVAEQMAFCLEFLLGKKLESQYPEESLRYIQGYERLSPDQRAKLSPEQLAKVTWIYHVLALIDLEKNREQAARDKLAAIATSPDDFLAADALYRLGMLQMQAREFPQAKETFEHLLFATRSAESAVRATYALADCLAKLDRPEQAGERLAQIVQRYPISPYAELARKHPAFPAPPGDSDESHDRQRVAP